LKKLPGIGATLAERIIETRKKTPFKKVDDLRNVSGIGSTKLENMRPFVTVGEAEAEKKE
jgi:competence protein ComEA